MSERAVRPLDLDRESSRVLELPALLDAVAGRAATPAGGARLRALTPASEPSEVEARQAAAAEAGRLLRESGRMVAGALPDPEPALAALRVEGMGVEAPALRDLAAVLVAAAELRRTLRALPPEDYPILAALGGALPDLAVEARPLLAAIGPDGTISDDASPELRRIRTQIARTGDRLRRMLSAHLREPGAEAVIRDDFVTQRNGRFVIPVRTDAPRQVKGIVHAASSSGATLFVEPLESVDLNNELVRLSEQEIEEQERVIRGWADAFRRRLPEVEAGSDGLARADMLQAVALWARDAGAVRPRFAAGDGLLLREARHPLLDRRLREQGGACVPFTVTIPPGRTVLVISGPNAGGKTVSLKTVGLAVLAAQTGLPVPAEEAVLPVFEQVRADIGDHQSIDADLSTYSAHVQAVARFLREARRPCLFLFDEIGTGTEPGEGGALARAVLEAMIERGLNAVATTHLGSLKTWALAADGAASAAMEFDDASLRPTYRILMGAAGVSAGLQIARRMGLPDELVERARGHLGAESRESEATLDKLRGLAAEAQALRDDLAERDAQLARERERVASRAEADAEQLRKEAARELEQALKELREQGRKELAGIKDRKERARLEKAQFNAETRLKSEAARRQARILSAAGIEREKPAKPAGPFVPEPGMTVEIRSLQREGQIVEVREEKVIVRMGSATFTVPKSDLAPAGAPAPAPVPKSAGSVGALAREAKATRRPSDLTSTDTATEEAPLELLLLGKTVEEALAEVDKFLDRSARSGRAEVRIVHGHGTGRLKQGVRQFLRAHPLVTAHRPGAPNEGGDGATVVTLR